MSEAIYQDPIVGLARSAEGAGTLDAPTASDTVDNPLCGDRVTIDLRITSGRIEALAHRVRGCLLCQASAAAIARAAVGATESEIDAGAHAVETMLKSGAALDDARFAPFKVFAPVAGHRSRHDCVLLPLRATLHCLKLTRPH